MTISKQQFQYLQEMGIPVYLTREKDAQGTLASDSEVNSKLNDNLLTHPLVKDILQSMNLSQGEVSVNKTHISLDTLDWYFSEQDRISLSNSQLQTPELAKLAANGQLKKALWQVLNEHFNSAL